MVGESSSDLRHLQACCDEERHIVDDAAYDLDGVVQPEGVQCHGYEEEGSKDEQGQEDGHSLGILSQDLCARLDDGKDAHDEANDSAGFEDDDG